MTASAYECDLAFGRADSAGPPLGKGDVSCALLSVTARHRAWPSAVRRTSPAAAASLLIISMQHGVSGCKAHLVYKYCNVQCGPRCGGLLACGVARLKSDGQESRVRLCTPLSGRRRGLRGVESLYWLFMAFVSV